MLEVILWLSIGGTLGYFLGVVRTTMKYMERMSKELHECHVKLHEAEKGAEDA
jgi:hypothetical protein